MEYIDFKKDALEQIELLKEVRALLDYESKSQELA